jgi:hypothetical protein
VQVWPCKKRLAWQGALKGLEQLMAQLVDAAFKAGGAIGRQPQDEAERAACCR